MELPTATQNEVEAQDIPVRLAGELGMTVQVAESAPATVGLRAVTALRVVAPANANNDMATTDSRLATRACFALGRTPIISTPPSALNRALASAARTLAAKTTAALRRLSREVPETNPSFPKGCPQDCRKQPLNFLRLTLEITHVRHRTRPVGAFSSETAHPTSATATSDRLPHMRLARPRRGQQCQSSLAGNSVLGCRCLSMGVLSGPSSFLMWLLTEVDPSSIRPTSAGCCTSWRMLVSMERRAT
jgi:hypothetical protein